MSSAVGETSNVAGKRSSQSNASAVGKKSSLEQRIVGVGGSEKLINTGGKSSSVNVENNNNNFVEHSNCRNNVRKRRKLDKTYAHLIHDTIINLKARKGSTSNAISKNIEKLHGSSLGPNYKKVVRHTLKKLTADGKLIRTGHSFRLAPKFKGKFDMNPFNQQQQQLTTNNENSKEKLEQPTIHGGYKTKGRLQAHIKRKRHRKQKRCVSRRRQIRRRSTSKYKYHRRLGYGLYKRRRPRLVMCPLAMRRQACAYRYSRRRSRSRCGSRNKRKTHYRKKKSTSPIHSSATYGDSARSSCTQSVASSK
ncbi:hypothetical protein BDL97_06G072600 [Sphagnum fallax]|nr:hypothetical protein BDL97_06G072600 [Sphagnum fallax]